MKKRYLVIVLILMGFQFKSEVKEHKKFFTVFLVRHAEKDYMSDNYADPPLTDCGEKRALSLRDFLSAEKIQAVYSTETTRTVQTAQPLAEAKGCNIESYNENELDKLAETLIKKKQNALVVGHSYTTGALAGLLTEQELEEIALDSYDRIYQVVFYRRCSELHLLHSSFSCTEEK